MNRYLFTAVPWAVFSKDTSAILKAVLHQMARGFAALYTSGIEVDGELFYFCLTGVKGDAEFHVDAGEFVRSYYNVGHVNNWEMCSECMANDNFGDVSDNPAWLPTVPCMGLERTSRFTTC